MNRFDEKYEFRIAYQSDIENIMNYIDTEWKKGHILAVNKEIFEYEFGNGERVNFVLAIDKESQSIEGMLGFYPASLDTDHLDTWGSVWTARKSTTNYPFLGLEILKRFKELVQYRSEIGVGINPKTAMPLQSRMTKDTVGKLSHYYMLQDLEQYEIAEIKQKRIVEPKKTKGNYHLVKCESIEELEQLYDFDSRKHQIPYKDAWYVNKRFFKHPVYRYDIYAVVDGENKADAVIIIREIQNNGRKVLRIVDYLGKIELFAEMGSELKNLMDTTCEYIDFYCYGFEESPILTAGFVLKTADSDNIIPNYFEPFVKSNVELWFNSTVQEGFVICKADADQDRPNFVK